MMSATPASSLHEDHNESRYEPASDIEESAVHSHSFQRTHGHRPSQSTGSSNPRPLPIGDARDVTAGGSQVNPLLRGYNSSGGDEGNNNQGGARASWEPDENVSACPLCNRRFTAFLRRHHCRQANVFIDTNEVDTVEEWYVIDARPHVIPFRPNGLYGIQ